MKAGIFKWIWLLVVDSESKKFTYEEDIIWKKYLQKFTGEKWGENDDQIVWVKASNTSKLYWGKKKDKCKDTPEGCATIQCDPDRLES